MRTTIPGRPCNVTHMAAQTRLVETPNGRTLRVEVAGDGERVVVAHLGTPNPASSTSRGSRMPPAAA
jgi:hypothetical protein